jgi:ribosomal protein L31E
MSSTTPIRIVAAEPREGSVLWLRFSDEATRAVGLTEVRVDEELGTIVWSNGADMDPDVLRGEAEAADRPDASAAA